MLGLMAFRSLLASTVIVTGGFCALAGAAVMPARHNTAMTDTASGQSLMRNLPSSVKSRRSRRYGRQRLCPKWDDAGSGLDQRIGRAFQNYLSLTLTYGHNVRFETAAG